MFVLPVFSKYMEIFYVINSCRALPRVFESPDLEFTITHYLERLNDSLDTLSRVCVAPTDSTLDFYCVISSIRGVSVPISVIRYDMNTHKLMSQEHETRKELTLNNQAIKCLMYTIKSKVEMMRKIRSRHNEDSMVVTNNENQGSRLVTNNENQEEETDLLEPPINKELVKEREFEANIKTYDKIKKAIDGDLKKIPDLFADEYPIFSYMDEKGILTKENYETYKVLRRKLGTIDEMSPPLLEV